MTYLRRLHHKVLGDLRKYFHNNFGTNSLYQAIAKPDREHTVLNLDNRTTIPATLLTNDEEIANGQERLSVENTGIP